MTHNEKFYVYIWRDPKNNIERYVGWTINEKRPYSYRKKSHNKQLHYMIQTRITEGYDLQPEVILCPIQSENFAKLMECCLIEKYGRKDKGTGTLFNLTDGGDGATGLIPSEETRKKMSVSRTGHIVTEETRAKIGKKHKNKMITEESKIKRRATLAEKRLSKPPKPPRKKMSKEEKGAHISAALMGHPVSEETRRKIGANTSEHLSGRKQSPEHVAKRTASRRRTMLARAQEQEK